MCTCTARLRSIIRRKIVLVEASASNIERISEMCNKLQKIASQAVKKTLVFDNAADNTAERFLMLTKHYINLSRNTTAKTRLLKTNMNTIPAEASGTDQKAANREATYAILKCRCQGQYITALYREETND